MGPRPPQDRKSRHRRLRKDHELHFIAPDLRVRSSRSRDDGVEVSAIDPVASMQAIDTPALHAVA